MKTWNFSKTRFGAKPFKEKNLANKVEPNHLRWAFLDNKYKFCGTFSSMSSLGSSLLITDIKLLIKLSEILLTLIILNGFIWRNKDFDIRYSGYLSLVSGKTEIYGISWILYLKTIEMSRSRFLILSAYLSSFQIVNWSSYFTTFIN